MPNALLVTIDATHYLPDHITTMDVIVAAWETYYRKASPDGEAYANPPEYTKDANQADHSFPPRYDASQYADPIVAIELVEQAVAEGKYVWAWPAQEARLVDRLMAFDTDAIMSIRITALDAEGNWS